jgi:hypothetical protein
MFYAIIKALESFESNSFTNFRETEFVYLFLCTKNVNKNIQFRRFGL